MQFASSILIDAPKEKVWSIITNFEQAASTIQGIISSEVLEKPAEGLVGLKWKETRSMFGKESSETMWITDAVKDAYYTAQAESHGAIYTSKMSVKEIDGQTRLTMSFYRSHRRL